MGTSVGGARRAAWRLFFAYTTASLLPVLALAFALVQESRQQAVERGLEQGRAQSAVVQEMAVAPALTGNDLRAGLSMLERSKLQRATDLAIYSRSIVRMRLRDVDGAVVFSDDGTTVDGARVRGPHFQAAAVDGRLEVVVQASPVEGHTKVIRSLQPVSTASGRTVGVLELYLPYDEIEADSAEHLHNTYERLAWGLGLLWLVLALISWSSSRSLRRQALLREHQALHDHLTGLPNRAAFLHAVQAAVRSTSSRHRTVVLLDLDGFKAVNDTLGHAAGDLLLQHVARRLTAAVDGGEVAARLGGDEFALLLAGERGSAVDARLQELVRSLAEPVTLDGQLVRVGASVGSATAPDDGATVDRLMRVADAAMYEVKRSTSAAVHAHVPAPRTSEGVRT